MQNPDALTLETRSSPLEGTSPYEIRPFLQQFDSFTTGETELQGTVIQRSRTLVIMTYAITTVLITVFGTKWPLLGIALLLMVIKSGITDIEGGRGWVRGLLIKQISVNVIRWHTPRITPLEGVAAEDSLLLYTNTDGTQIRSRIQTLLAGLTIVGVFLAAFSLAFSVWMPAVATTLLSFTIGEMLFTAVGCYLHHSLTKTAVSPSPTQEVLFLIAKSIQENPLENIKPVFCFSKDTAAFHDGLEIFLKNFSGVLPPSQTRVLVLHPDKGEMSMHHREGRIRPYHSDVLISAVAEDLPQRQNTTASSRARMAGWSAAAISGDFADPTVSAEKVMAFVRQLDKAAGKTTWSSS